MHVIAARRAQFGRDPVGEQAQFVQVLAADADLDRLVDRRPLFDLVGPSAGPC